MAIDIIVEDGTGANPLANSYASIADIRTYLTNRGVTLPVDNDAVAALILQGMDYLGTKACQWQGVRTYNDPAAPPVQPLDWPRTGVCLNGVDYPADGIPAQLVAALAQLVKAQNEGINPMPNVTAADYVTEETVDVITTKYADPVSVGMTPTLTAVDAFLAPLFGNCAAFFGFTTYRV